MKQHIYVMWSDYCRGFSKAFYARIPYGVIDSVDEYMIAVERHGYMPVLVIAYNISKDIMKGKMSDGTKVKVPKICRRGYEIPARKILREINRTYG